MTMYEIIAKKRDGHKLSQDEIEFFIDGYTNERIMDYQASALLMAMFLRGLDEEETFWLTDAMRRSGETVDLSPIPGVKVDKHSTGGVGDKTTLIVAPLAAACGVPIAKMSGRGLGFTGGTVDKMESIPGFRTSLEPQEFLDLVNTVGMSVIGQTAHIAAADKKLYALRDVTATVDNMSLIASSIMSKKLASGSDAIVLDVKTGGGAFMEKEEDAEALGILMVKMGKASGKKTIAVITDMNQPLGNAVGNSVEVIEAIETLKGQGPEDITELALTLSGLMIYAGEKASTPAEGRTMAEEALKSGRALAKLGDFIEGQSGDRRVIDDYGLFPQATIRRQAVAGEDGFVQRLEARAIGMASQHAGAGRATKEDTIDLAAGIILCKKTGDAVKKGDVLAEIFGNDEAKVDGAVKEAMKAFHIGLNEPEIEPLIKKILM
ncbi:MAG: thymidine phosphorylase [Firmicutes bacterium]|nr:thymidine phosphorylase [Bacillota bacterium]